MSDTDTRTLQTDSRRTDRVLPIGVRVRVQEEVLAMLALRQAWSLVLTPTGRQSQGPSFMAVTSCDVCGHITLTTSKRAKAQRWRCRNVWSETTECSALIKPILADRGTKAYEDWNTYREETEQ
jgi:hypothetical protein